MENPKSRRRLRMKITLEIVESRSPGAFEDFNKIMEKVTKDAGEKGNVTDLLTQTILVEFICYCAKARKKPPADYGLSVCEKATRAPEQLLKFEPKKKRSAGLKSKKTDPAARDKNRKRALEPKKHESVAYYYCHGDDMSYSEEEQVERKSTKPKRKSKKLRLMQQKDRGSRNINKNREKEEEEEGQSKQHKRQKKNPEVVKQVVLDQPPLMPAELSHKIMGLQGSDINLVIQKELTYSDMKASLSRLSIPSGQMRYDFLTRGEQVHFNAMEVKLIEPSLEESTIFLKKWKMVRRGSGYVLSRHWINVANKNGLESGDTVQLWSFRVNHKLHLALVKLDN